MRADGSGYRNLLIAQRTAHPVAVQHPHTHVDESRAMFAQRDLTAALGQCGLPVTAPLSVIAIEVYAGIHFDANFRETEVPSRGTGPAQWVLPPNLFDTRNLGQRRIVRTSALTSIAPMC